MVLIIFNFIKVTSVFKPSQIHNKTGHKCECVDKGLKITHFSIRFSQTPTVLKLYDGCLKVRREVGGEKIEKEELMLSKIRMHDSW